VISNEEGGVDMCKKLVTICLVLFLVPVSYVQADEPPLLVGSWENYDNEGWQDHPLLEASGWTDGYVDDPQVMPSRYVFSNDWATEGEVSLQANVGGWDWYQRKDVHNDFFDHSYLEFDVVAADLDGSGATFAQIEQMVYSSETEGWYQLPGVQFNLTLGTPEHCVVDYATPWYTDGYTQPTDGYGSFIFALNGDAQVYIYMDNVQLTGPPIIPEPATISLLSLGGLLVLRRKW
jgi:hypothetical protein